MNADENLVDPELMDDAVSSAESRDELSVEGKRLQIYLIFF